MLEMKPAIAHARIPISQADDEIPTRKVKMTPPMRTMILFFVFNSARRASLAQRVM